MSWIILAVIAYVLMAGVGISDKYFLRHRMPSALAYGFSVGVLGLVFILAIPFGFRMPSPMVLVAAILSGVIFTFALVVLFWTLKQASVSRVIPAIGALFPVFTLILASFLVNERLEGREIIGFAILVVCGVLLAVSRGADDGRASVVFLGAGAVALLYALSSVLAKYAFSHHPFLSAFIWMRIAGGATALSWLLVSRWRVQILGAVQKPGSGVTLIVLLRMVAGAAFIMLHYAIALGSVTIVNALKGVEYAALFVGTLLVSRLRPDIIHETLEKKLVLAKTIAIGGIIVGVWLVTGA